MNFLDIRAGDKMEIGTQKSFRFWRYDLDPEVVLRSWCSDMRWHPGQPVEGTSPDKGEQGIHGFKTIDDLRQSTLLKIGIVNQMLFRSRVTGHDGFVIGTIEMWGIIWEHERGYRAQFARPLSFDASYGDRCEEVLPELRRRFFQ